MPMTGPLLGGEEKKKCSIYKRNLIKESLILQLVQNDYNVGKDVME
jgi:hypothetical protein